MNTKILLETPSYATNPKGPQETLLHPESEALLLQDPLLMLSQLRRVLLQELTDAGCSRRFHL